MVAPNVAYDEQSSFIDKLDPREVIPLIGEQLLGIATTLEFDGPKQIKKIKRYSKPTFTEEFVSLLKHTLFGYVNNVNSFSKYQEDDIKLRVKNIGEELHTFFATYGNDHFISELTWRKVLEIHDSKESWRKFNVDWTVDKPVTYEMIAYVKDFDENVDQEVVFMQVASHCRRLIDSCYRRSLVMPDNYGMMPSLINNTRNEAYASQNNPNNYRPMMPPQQGGWQ